jgi:hypothetical protein
MQYKWSAAAGVSTRWRSALHAASQEVVSCADLAIPPGMGEHEGEIWQGRDAASAVS